MHRLGTSCGPNLYQTGFPDKREARYLDFANNHRPEGLAARRRRSPNPERPLGRALLPVTFQNGSVSDGQPRSAPHSLVRADLLACPHSPTRNIRSKTLRAPLSRPKFWYPVPKRSFHPRRGGGSSDSAWGNGTVPTYHEIYRIRKPLHSLEVGSGLFDRQGVARVGRAYYRGSGGFGEMTPSPPGARPEMAFWKDCGGTWQMRGAGSG